MDLLSFYKIVDNKRNLCDDSDFQSVFENQEIEKIFNENRTSLLNDFFEKVTERLNNKEFNNIFRLCCILNFSPIREGDYQRLEKLIFSSMKIMISDYEKHDIKDLAEFLWQILDHTLHEWTIYDEKTFMHRLVLLNEELELLEKDYCENVSMLRQKIGHFGIK
jgi:hypothetical protein